MLLRYVLAAAGLLAIQFGCTSMTSTMLTRDENNQFWTRKSNLKGVPITLKVPTHVQLTIFERHYLFADNTGKHHRIQLPFVVRDFSQNFIYSEKIFTVDFKRPAAGLYNLNLDLTPDQYIDELQHDVTDETIKQVTALVKQIAPQALKGPKFGAASGDPAAPFEEIQSVVAVDMFEIDAPDFEEQMTAFVNGHLNQAHESRVAPPGNGPAQRVSLPKTPPPPAIVKTPATQLIAPQPNAMSTNRSRRSVPRYVPVSVESDSDR